MVVYILALLCFSFMGGTLRGIVVVPQPSFSVPQPDFSYIIVPPTTNPLTPNYYGLPIVLVNDSGLSDDDLYVFISAVNPFTNYDTFGNINPETGVVSYFDITTSTYAGANRTQYTLPFSGLPLAYPITDPSSTDRIVYVPYMNGGLVWFSLNSPLNMPGNIGGLRSPRLCTTSL